MKKQSEANPFVVVVHRLGSSIRRNLVVVRDPEASAALKIRRPKIPSISMKSLFPVLAEWLGPLAVLYVVLHQMMGPSFFSSQRFFGLPGDSQQYMWFIGWVWRAIEHGQSPLVSNAFDYPHSITLMDYTSVPALGFFFGWLYAFASVVFVYNLMLVVNYTLILIFGKLALRALGIGPLFSSIGGFLFCLLPYLTAQAPAHLHLSFIAPLFIAGYFVARLTQSAKPPGWALGVGSGLAVTLAFYTSLETFSTMLLCLSLLYIFALIVCFRPTRHFTVNLLNPRFLLGISIPVLLIIPGLLNFVAGQGPLDLGLASTTVDFSNDLLSFFVPTQLYLVHTSATTALTSRFTGGPSEWDGYLSIPFIILFLFYAARGWKQPTTRILTYASVMMGIFSLGPILHIAGKATSIYLPWTLLLDLPFIREALPARLGLYTAALALIVILRGAEESTHRGSAQLEQRPQKLNRELVPNLAVLALVALLWLPLFPSYTSVMPKATAIIESDQVVSRYIGHEPTLVLYDQSDFGFSVAMGVFAASNSYGLVTSNIYGSTPILAISDSFWLNQTFTIGDSNGEQTDGALLTLLPTLRVDRIMFVSTDNRPISSLHLTELSELLGAPIFNRSRLVLVWTVPPSLLVGISGSGRA